MKNILDSHVKAYQGDNIYDFDNEIILKWYPHRVIKYSEGAKSMLELGLGHGYTTEIFSEHFKRYLVLDGSAAVIENFKTNHPTTKADILETYFEEFDTQERFDIINLGFILEHIDNPNQILEKFRKYLAPSGKMFVSVPNAEVMNRKLGHLAGLLPDMTVLSDNDNLLGHKRYYTVETLKREIETAGYKLDRMEGIYLKPMTTSQLLSLNLSPEIIRALCQLGINYPELSCGMLAQIS